MKRITMILPLYLQILNGNLTGNGFKLSSVDQIMSEKQCFLYLLSSSQMAVLKVKFVSGLSSQNVWIKTCSLHIFGTMVGIWIAYSQTSI